MIEFSPKLQQAAATLQLTLSADQQNALLKYLEQLQRWNRTYNLTAIRDPEQMLVHHIFDSLSIVKHLETAIDDNTSDGQSSHIVDVGSGAGLPGVVIAIMKPRWWVTCVDAVEKKTAFIRQMAGVLQLPNLKAVHNRIEILQPQEATIVTSRAFASLADFVNLAQQHVAKHGWLVAMKGQVPHDEISEMEATTSWKVNRVEPIAVPELNAQRCLIWLEPKQGTA